MWQTKWLGTEPEEEDWKIRVEVDENHILRSNNTSILQFEIYCQDSNDVRLVVIDNDRSKEMLLLLIEKYVRTDIVYCNLKPELFI